MEGRPLRVPNSPDSLKRKSWSCFPGREGRGLGSKPPPGSAAFQAAALGKVLWLQEFSLPS